MAHLREYEYYESMNLLIKHFYWFDTDKEPALTIRIDTNTLEMHVYPYKRCVSRLCIVTEVEKLLLLLDEPYWKSFVKVTSASHRDRNYELF